MTHDPLSIGSQIVGLIYRAKHQHKMAMNRFAVLVGMVDALVIMAGLSRNSESGVLYDPGAHTLTAEILETIEEHLPHIFDQIPARMLISRAHFHELVASGEVTPLELLMLLRDELGRNYGKQQLADG